MTTNRREFTTLQVGRVTDDNVTKLDLDASLSHFSVEISDTAEETYSEMIVSLDDRGDGWFQVRRAFGEDLTDDQDAIALAHEAARAAFEKGE
jgi:hypothetical protein